MISVLQGASLPILALAAMCILVAGSLFYINGRLNEKGTYEQ
jgi:hypothetical protein